MKTAIITGSAKRLGKDIALFLSKNNFNVVIQYLNSEADAKQLENQINDSNSIAVSFQCNIKDSSQVKNLVDFTIKEFGQIDLIVNNVGNYKLENIENYAIEDWDDTIQANLSGAYYLIHHSLDHIVKSSGNIVNIGYSGVENISPNLNATAYSISKTGLLILTKSLAKQLGPKNVRVNMVSPGQLEYSIDLPKDLSKRIPLGRAGTSDDVINAIEFILNNDYLTGINIDVAGGYML